MFEYMTTTGAPTALEALAGLEAALGAAQAAVRESLWQLGEGDLVEALKRAHRLDGRLAALQITVVREVDTRVLAAAQGATSTKALLAGALTMSPGLAGERVRLAEALNTRFAGTGTALASGAVAYEQAKAISEVVGGLPKAATTEVKHEIETFLLGKADELNARDIRSLAKVFDNVIDPDGTPDREDAVRAKRALNVRDHHDGTQTLTWTDTDEHMALAKAAIDALAAPVPAADGERDARSPATRRADAMVEVFGRILGAGDLSDRHGVRPHLHVTFTEPTLHNEPGAPFGRTSTGEDLSPATIERLMCDADITGILLDGAGVPLRVGRTRRTVTHGQWIALVARDVGCQFPNCARPAAWCEAHHAAPWSQGGNTDLDGLALYCGAHHKILHEQGWTARMGPDGRPEVVPPGWIDPEQRPRRNLTWHLLRELRTHVAEPDP